VTVSFEVRIFGCCVLWRRANFRSCLAFVALLKVSWLIRDQSDSDSTLAERRCTSSSSRDVWSSSHLLLCILSRSRAKLVR
jgi:hypothetical protein